MHAVYDQGIQKVFDLYIPVPVTFPTDKIHFSADLFKVVKSIGIFSKDFVSVVLQTQMSQVDKPGGCCPADSLFHRFRSIAEMAAEVIESQITDFCMVLDHIFHYGYDVPAPDVSGDPKLFKNGLESGKGFGEREEITWFSRDCSVTGLPGSSGIVPGISSVKSSCIF